MSGVKVWVKMMPLMSFKKSQLFVPLLCSRNVFIQLLSTDAKDRVSVDWSFAGLPCHKVTISARAFRGLRAVLAKPCGSHPFSWFLRPIFVVAKKAAKEPVKYIILFVFLYIQRLNGFSFLCFFLFKPPCRFRQCIPLLVSSIPGNRICGHCRPRALAVIFNRARIGSNSVRATRILYPDACFFNTGKSNLRSL